MYTLWSWFVLQEKKNWESWLQRGGVMICPNLTVQKAKQSLKRFLKKLAHNAASQKDFNEEGMAKHIQTF